MFWQDWVFALVGFIFTLALIPTIIKRNKPPYTTVVVTALCSSTVAITLLTLDMFVAAAGCLLSSVGWWTILVQKTIIDRIYHDKLGDTPIRAVGLNRKGRDWPST